MIIKQITGLGEGGLWAYVIGFGLSIVLTIIPFFLVMTSAMIGSTILITISLLAIAQIIVHLICFLHLKPSSAQSWNGFVFIYTLILLVMLVGASTWIMHHLQHNMMIN